VPASENETKAEPTTETKAEPTLEAEPESTRRAEAKPESTRRHDVAALTELLGRPPRGAFDVVVRDDVGSPVVIRNAPLLDDGTPMPTRYWLVDPLLVTAVSRLEATGGVRAAERAVASEDLRRAHERYAAERDAAVPANHTGPRPSGGVGGTRTGVKCLHAHYAYVLAGGDDPVGRWVAAHLAEHDERVRHP
jgi:hypothetical protein